MADQARGPGHIARCRLSVVERPHRAGFELHARRAQQPGRLETAERGGEIAVACVDQFGEAEAVLDRELRLQHRPRDLDQKI